MINTEEFLNILKTDDKKVFKLGKIDPGHVSGDPKILFDGETTVSVKKYKTINYSPIAGDRVLLVRLAGTYLVLGKVGSYSASGERGPGITNIADNGDGTLTITYGDGLIVTTSDVTGPQGEQGIQGDPGTQGEVGPPGEQGEPGPAGGNITTANQLPIADTNEHFTSDNVEGALNELFINVNDGKGLIATAIVDKGGVADGSDTFIELAAEITNLPSGGGSDSVVAGNTIVLTDSELASTTDINFVKVKEFQMLKGGTATFIFNLRRITDYSVSATGRLYKNGIAVGTQRNVTSSNYETFSEVLPFDKNDLMQLYMKKGLNPATVESNFFSIGITLDSSEYVTKL